MLLTYQPSKQPLDREYTQEPASYQQQVDDVETPAYSSEVCHPNHGKAAT